MPLINCLACARQISSAATACPGCGHPNDAAAAASTGPSCYACSAAATTRCQSCGALSCAVHLQSIYVSHGKGGAYELRCESCHSSAMLWKFLGPAIAIALIAIFYFAVIAPKQREFDRKWNGDPVPNQRP